MATKRASVKKSTKKSAAKKSSKKSSKKSAKKSSKKTARTAALLPSPIGGGGVEVGFPNLNLRCILGAVAQYNSCLKKGVDQATCQKRLQRNILKCMGGGGGIFDEGGGVVEE